MPTDEEAGRQTDSQRGRARARAGAGAGAVRAFGAGAGAWHRRVCGRCSVCVSPGQLTSNKSKQSQPRQRTARQR